MSNFDFKKTYELELVEELAAEIHKTREQEKMLAQKRYDLEKQLIEIVGVKDEGSFTTNASVYKIKIDQKINHSIDVDVWNEIKDEFSEEISPVVYKPLFSKTRFQNLIKKSPALYRTACKAITSKPAKTYVTIKIEE